MRPIQLNMRIDFRRGQRFKRSSYAGAEDIPPRRSEAARDINNNRDD